MDGYRVFNVDEVILACAKTVERIDKRYEQGYEKLISEHIKTKKFFGGYLTREEAIAKLNSECSFGSTKVSGLEIARDNGLEKLKKILDACRADGVDKTIMLSIDTISYLWGVKNGDRS